jgi:hypothetical protein
LTLEHNHPVGNSVKAAVNINLLLGTVKSHETQIGEWVNVIGYVEAGQQTMPNESKGIKQLDILVQAIVLWSSGPVFKPEGYERSLDAQKQASG